MVSIRPANIVIGINAGHTETATQRVQSDPGFGEPDIHLVCWTAISATPAGTES